MLRVRGLGPGTVHLGGQPLLQLLLLPNQLVQVSIQLLLPWKQHASVYNNILSELRTPQVGCVA